ncbi:MAG: esterase [Actinomycetota bacterium]|nr:esterase [Actinomycetota bacterium]
MQLHTIRHGPEPARFVLVHGLASNARMWDGVGAALAARGIGSVAVDLRGHGLSPKPDDGYDFATVSADLVPLLVERPIVAGQSYGGNVVVALAARHPELVSGIACVDGGAIDARARFASIEECLDAMKPPYHLFEGVAPDVTEARLRQAHPDGPETWIQGAMACFEVVDGGIRSRLTWARHAQIVEAMWDEPPTPLFPSIKVPVLFITATERMRAGVEAALEVLPDGRAIWFEGAHHDVHAQRPDDVADALTTML